MKKGPKARAEPATGWVGSVQVATEYANTGLVAVACWASLETGRRRKLVSWRLKQKNGPGRAGLDQAALEARWEHGSEGRGSEGDGAPDGPDVDRLGVALRVEHDFGRTIPSRPAHTAQREMSCICRAAFGFSSRLVSSPLVTSLPLRQCTHKERKERKMLQSRPTPLRWKHCDRWSNTKKNLRVDAMHLDSTRLDESFFQQAVILSRLISCSNCADTRHSKTQELRKSARIRSFLDSSGRWIDDWWLMMNVIGMCLVSSRLDGLHKICLCLRVGCVPSPEAKTRIERNSKEWTGLGGEGQRTRRIRWGSLCGRAPGLRRARDRSRRSASQGTAHGCRIRDKMRCVWHRTGHAQVQMLYLQIACRVQKQIRGLQVPMQYIGAVNVLEAYRNISDWLLYFMIWCIYNSKQ